MELQAPLSLLALAALLLAAMVCDLRSRRIPNVLVATGVALGLLLQTVAQAGGGLFGNPVGALGLVPALLGGLAGLGLFLPLYALRAMGAGDVKLLAMVGVWLGATGVLHAALWTLVAGGVLSLVVALYTGVVRQVLANLRFMLTATLIKVQGGAGLTVEAPARTTGRLPFALAIASGTGVELFRMFTAS